MFAQAKNLNVRVLEWYLAITVAGSIIIPRLSWLFLAGLAAVSAFQILQNTNALKQFKLKREVVLALSGVSVFLLYAFLSILWSTNANHAFAKLATVTGLHLIALLVLLRVSLLSNSELEYLKRGIFVGFLIGVLYYVIEVFSEGFLVASFINFVGHDMELTVKYPILQNGSVVFVNLVVFNQHAIALCLFIWPALTIWTQSSSAKSFTILSLFAVFAAVAIAVFFSVNESAKLALFTGSIIFLIALYSTKLSAVLIGSVWIAVTLLVLPATDFAYRAELHKSGWIQPSGQERIKIWKATNDLYWRQPIFGAGVRAAQKRSMERRKTIDAYVASSKDLRPRHYLAHHAHNSFLQIWYELGLVGAILFSAAGLLILNALRGSNAQLQPHGHALAISVITVMGFSYGFWQTWYQAIVLLAVIVYSVCVRNIRDS